MLSFTAALWQTSPFTCLQDAFAELEALVTTPSDPTTTTRAHEFEDVRLGSGKFERDERKMPRMSMVFSSYVSACIVVGAFPAASPLAVEFVTNVSNSNVRIRHTVVKIVNRDEGPVLVSTAQSWYCVLMSLRRQQDRCVHRHRCRPASSTRAAYRQTHSQGWVRSPSPLHSVTVN